jgi:ABC-type nitrate/sulfonate/bicarbonate transport system substrate-binding protein
MSTSVHAGRSRQGSRAHLALAVLALVLAVTGCSSSPRQPLPPPQSGTLRLGYTAVLADAPALAGLQLGFLPPDLGTVGLDPVAYGSPQAEELALERGQLDAAYLDPVAASGSSPGSRPAARSWSPATGSPARRSCPAR